MLLFLILCAGFSSTHGYTLSCGEVPKDVVIILDSSTSISDDDFNHAKKAILMIIESLQLKESDSRVAFEQFGSSARLVFNLDTYNDIAPIKKAIENAEHTNGLTAIGKALILAKEQVVSKMRVGIIRLVILITDGANNVFPTPEIPASDIKNADVKIISIGIGTHVNGNQLQAIASDNSKILLSSFGKLQTNLNEILDHLCQLPDPVPHMPCVAAQQDLVFLIDSSESLTPADYQYSKDFIKSVLGNVKLGPDDTRVAMISFAESVRLDFNIDAFSVQKDYFDAVDKAVKFGTATAIGAALREALNTVWPKRRETVPFNVILVTDGVNNRFPKPQIPATDLKNKGATVISIAVGTQTDYDELKAVSSENKLINLLDYSELSKHITSVQKVVLCG